MLLKFQLLIYARNKSLIEIFVNIYANFCKVVLLNSMPATGNVFFI